jgi:hypothetical protein
MNLIPTAGKVILIQQSQQLSKTLAIPTGVKLPTLWAVHTSAHPDFVTGQYVVPNTPKAVKMTINDVEYYFIDGDDIWATVDMAR